MFLNTVVADYVSVNLESLINLCGLNGRIFYFREKKVDVAVRMTFINQMIAAMEKNL